MNRMENSIVYLFPNIAHEWHPTKNGELTPENISVGSNRKVWWRCAVGHEWEAVVSSRVKGSGCPYCSGKKAIKGVNDLSTSYPLIAKEWHPTKNSELTPDMVTSHSGMKVWWMCKEGHEWQASIDNRSKGNGCPFCSGRYAISGINDLATINPELAKEWHPLKNGELLPSVVKPQSNLKVWWMCPKGHEWQALIVNRTKGDNCPYCSNHKVLKGFNDLCTLNPELTKEWHPTKNGEFFPDMVTSFSKNKVWWMCPKGHEWQASISSRSKGSGCPFCANKKAIKGITDLQTLYPKLAKEWHPTKNGYLKPEMVSAGSQKFAWWVCSEGHEWRTRIANRSRGSGCPYCSNNKVLSGFNDLVTVNPELAREWHPTKNGDLLPSMVVYCSEKVVWWMCSEGHEWQAKVYDRITGSGCLYCSNRKILQGYNDLATTNPQLAKEWHPTKNGDLLPTMVVAGSGKKVWWQCEKGHEWQAVISSRHSGVGCPICAKESQTSFPEQAIYYYIKKSFPDAVSGDKSILSFFELDIFIPSIKTAIEYDGLFWHINNEERDIRKNIECEKKHIRLVRIREKGLPRMSNDCIVRYNSSNEDLNDTIDKLYSLLGVQYLFKIDVKKDYFNIMANYVSNEKELSLESVNNEIAKEWHPTKNYKLLPSMVSARSTKKVWWQCEKGHEWQASVSSRIEGSLCPFCNNRKVLKGYNDLATLNPDLAREWHPTKNYDLTPEMVTIGSDKKVWWQCEKGHEWQATVAERKVGKGCPYCKNRKLLTGFNDLATVNPELAKEWHLTKNGDLLPTMVVAGSGKKVWWQCEKGHEWQAVIASRNNGCGCQICYYNRKKKI